MEARVTGQTHKVSGKMGPPVLVRTPVPELPTALRPAPRGRVTRNIVAHRLEGSVRTTTRLFRLVEPAMELTRKAKGRMEARVSKSYFLVWMTNRHRTFSS